MRMREKENDGRAIFRKRRSGECDHYKLCEE